MALTTTPEIMIADATLSLVTPRSVAHSVLMPGIRVVSTTFS